MNTPEEHSASTPPPSPLTQQLFSRKSVAISLVVLILGFVGVLFIQTALTTLPSGTTLGSIDVGGLNQEEALAKFAQLHKTPTEIVLATEEITVASASAESGLAPQPVPALAAAIPTNQIERIIWYINGLRNPHTIPIVYDFQEETVLAQLEELSTQIDSESQEPGVVLERSGQAGSLAVNPGKIGKGIDSSTQKLFVFSEIAKGNTTIRLTPQLHGRELTQDEVVQTASVAATLVGSALTFSAERLSLTLSDQDMVSLLNPPNTFNAEKVTELLDEWDKQVGTPPQNPELTLSEDNTKVLAFTPPRNGRKLQREETAMLIAEVWRQILAGEEYQRNLTLPLVEATPPVSLQSTNDLGINERIGFGESHYSGSIANRVHNVAITTERINNTLVPPGAEFSFNKTLGDVSATTGFRSAYVIKNGRTEMGDGGGVCQVSTTLFRSVLNAGLNITRRLPHSYRVSYYEQDSKPGLDATVYAGETDFRFINDTDGYVLVHAVANSANTYMYVELYGTSDGRYTTITEHKTWGATGALPPEYFPDPSLPAGKLVQIDWPAGGIKAGVTNVIYNKDGSVRKTDVFNSNYRPWSAKFLQGTGG